MRAGGGDRPWAPPCRTSWWKTRPPPRRASPCCAGKTPAAPPSCLWTRSSRGCSGASCPAGPAGQQPGPGRGAGIGTSSPTFWAGSWWWRTSTPPPGWPGSCTTATGWSPWTARWSTPGQLHRRQRPAVGGPVHPAGRRSGSCRTRSRAWPGTAPPPGCAPPSARARPTPWQAELTAAEGEERTAAGDRVRAEAEGRRLEQAVRQAEEAARQRSAEAGALASEAGRQAEAAEKAAEAGPPSRPRPAP